MSVLSYNSLSVNLIKNILNFEIHNIWKIIMKYMAPKRDHI